MLIFYNIKRVAFSIFLLISSVFPFKADAQSQEDIIYSGKIPEKAASKNDYHSPGKAALYSTFLPGLGQIYNKHYLKVPVIYAGGALITYFAATNYQGARKFKKEYIYMNSTGNPCRIPGYDRYNETSILNLYNGYEKNYELSLVIGGLVYLLNILDAYVYAHLFSFTINDDLSMRFSPEINYIPSCLSTAIPSAGFKWSISF